MNRVMRGLIGICERSPNLYAANQALIVARLIDDHTSASKIARLWMKNHHSCVHGLWDWDLKKFNDTMNWALADAPLKAEEANAEPTKQDSLSEYFALWPISWSRYHSAPCTDVIPN